MSSDYEYRLGLMEEWYRDLVGLENGDQTLIEDYEPHREYLGSLQASVIDVGGGAGLAARFLSKDVDYVVVDPVELWESPDWAEFSRKFRAGGATPRFVKARGEELPFQDGQFDCALSFWSLNHVEDPKLCVLEMMRVLKPGGRGRIVLEDTEPRWGDLLPDAARRIWSKLTRTPYEPRIPLSLPGAFRMKLTGRWKVAEDHNPVSERDLLSWIDGRAAVQRREWIAGYLTFDLVRPQ